jgi:hypothetical protein
MTGPPALISQFPSHHDRFPGINAPIPEGADERKWLPANALTPPAPAGQVSGTKRSFSDVSSSSNGLDNPGGGSTAGQQTSAGQTTFQGFFLAQQPPNGTPPTLQVQRVNCYLALLRVFALVQLPQPPK